jgi:hypothetical protein
MNISSLYTCNVARQSNQVVLRDLTRNCNYEIVVVPFNSQGSGPLSPPVAVYVGEAVPTGEPQAVEGEAVSATEVRLRWKPPQQSQQNGDLLGYKASNAKFECRASRVRLFGRCPLRVSAEKPAKLAEGFS